MENQREYLQAAWELFASQEAETHIENQGVIDISAKIEEVGTATHDEWYGDLRDTAPILDEWYAHVRAPKSTKARNEETRRSVMDGTIPSAIVNSGVASNAGRYDNGLKMTGCQSTKVFKVAMG